MRTPTSTPTSTPAKTQPQRRLPTRYHPDRAGRGRQGSLWPVLLAVLLGLLLITNFKTTIWSNLVPKRFGQVVPNQIYRSGKLSTAALTRVVRTHHIRTIVDLGAWPIGSRADRREARTAAALGVDRVRFNLIGDATGDPNNYVKALRIMTDPSKAPLLVHCGAGTERTGCVVALYRMHEQGMSLEDALAEAIKAGHSPSRNPHLREMLNSWYTQIFDSLDSGKPIDFLPAQDTPEAPDALEKSATPASFTPDGGRLPVHIVEVDCHHQGSSQSHGQVQNRALPSS